MAQVDQTPYRTFAAITPHDSTNIPTGPTDAIYVGGAGTVTVVDANNGTVSFTAVAGAILPIRIKRVNATGTAGTLLIALYH